MPILNSVLEQEVNRFFINPGGGLSFWAPYLRNDNYTQDSSVPRGFGKSSPDEIKTSAEFISRLYPSLGSEGVRLKLIDGSLPESTMNYKGIDCSGFAYYVLNGVYKNLFGYEIENILSVPKIHVLNGAYNLDEWKAEYQLTNEEADSLPEEVPMSWVINTFRRQAVSLCRVAGLTSDFSSDPIDISQAKPGDLVHLIGTEGAIPHVAIILNTGKELTVAHSVRESSVDVGGVMIDHAPVIDGVLDTKSMHVARKFLGIRRLRQL